MKKYLKNTGHYSWHSNYKLLLILSKSDRLLTNSMLPVCIMLSGIIVSEALGNHSSDKMVQHKKQKAFKYHIFANELYIAGSLFYLLFSSFMVCLDILTQIPDNFG